MDELREVAIEFAYRWPRAGEAILAAPWHYREIKMGRLELPLLTYAHRIVSLACWPRAAQCLPVPDYEGLLASACYMTRAEVRRLRAEGGFVL